MPWASAYGCQFGVSEKHELSVATLRPIPIPMSGLVIAVCLLGNVNELILCQAGLSLPTLPPSFMEIKLTYNIG